MTLLANSLFFFFTTHLTLMVSFFLLFTWNLCKVPQRRKRKRTVDKGLFMSGWALNMPRKCEKKRCWNEAAGCTTTVNTSEENKPPKLC